MDYPNTRMRRLRRHDWTRRQSVGQPSAAKASPARPLKKQAALP
jgi:hypothetical protein